MKKIVTLLLILCISQASFSQSNGVPEKQKQTAFGKVDFLSIEMPGNEANMGFTGIHYNLNLTDWGAYAGVGLYGAVTGIRGGFFTLGVNAGVKEYLSDRFFTDLGFHFGGGGGAGAPDGGGAFILPHVNMGYDFKDFMVQAGWSYVNFFDGGAIKSSQFNVGIEIPLDYEYANYKASEQSFDNKALKNSGWDQAAKKNSLLFHLNNLKIQGRTQRTSGQRYNGETIRLAGFEFASFFDENWFAFLKVDGAYHGIQAGFMDVFLGAGYLYSFNQNRTNILAKFSMGAGGGGGIETNGGFLVQPDISIEQKLFGDFFIAINKGYVFSPNSDVNTSSYGLGLKYYIQRNGIFTADQSFDNLVFKGITVSMKHDLYFDAQRDNRSPKDLHQISLQVDFDLSKRLYAAGQTSFANFGEAGAYAEGLVGLGLRSKAFFNNSTKLFAQVLGGAAGGGGISTGEGFIVKPSLGFSTKINDQLNFRTAAGYVKASGGGLSTTLVNFGLSYNISLLKRSN
ncbi:MAG: hypothetical protein CMB99_12635 [Flavobacteriaceae bacterium]|nr:hypothetical protein [Flavobacteriaceae bacterium]|tara:strand:- start:4882 stop:6414 length:1533 start_codon:yes stop_codon:yes gene_type:complete